MRSSGLRRSPGQFVGTDAVLAVRQEPEGGKPLLQTNSRILENRTDLERELLLGVLYLAEVQLSFFEVGDLLRATGGQSTTPSAQRTAIMN